MDLVTDDIKLMFGDCLERMKEIESGSIDMILTDPPYGTTACKWDSIIPLAPMWEQLKRIIKPNGAIVMTAAQPFTSALIMSNADMFKYCWYWRKNRATGVLNAKKQPLRNVEEVVVFNSKIYTPQGLLEVNISSRNSKKDYDNYGGGTCKEYTQKYTNYPTQLLNFDVVQRTVHSTQKPAPLMEYLIKTYTNEGETVLDFTMGSGTTGVAAVNTRRKFLGIEMDAEYYGISCGRIMDSTILSNSQSEGTL
jgi:site-specific DNA-methyltransferase (adenine-specific)